MFKNNFINFCNKKGESPSYVCKKVGLSPATFSCWNEQSVPRRATLQRIADYFEVNIDDLVADVQSGVTSANVNLVPFDNTAENLTQQEKTLLELFRGTTEEGRMRIIQSVLNIHDQMEEKKNAPSNSNLA